MVLLYEVLPQPVFIEKPTLSTFRVAASVVVTGFIPATLGLADANLPLSN